MTTPPVLVLGSSVLLSGQAVADALGLAVLGSRVAARDGIGTPPRVRVLVGALKDALKAQGRPGGHADVRDEAESAESDSRVTTSDAARVLGLSTRQVRRLAFPLAGVRGPGGWTYSAEALAAYAARRQEQAS